MISLKEIRELEEETICFLKSTGCSYFEYLERKFRNSNPLIVKIVEEVQSQINLKRVQPTLNTFYFFLYFLRLLEKSVKRDIYIDEDIAVQTVKQISYNILEDGERFQKEIRDFFLKHQVVGYMFKRLTEKECEGKEERTQVLIAAFIICKIFLNHINK